MATKKIAEVYKSQGRHWVGNGFHVHGLLSYQYRPDDFSPFLLLDFAEGEYFPATTEQRGVGQHPHRGFETVTIVFAGEAEHKDSQGNGGVIGPGDVQWMTAGSGIIHEEYHSKNFAEKGGMFEMVQLWVNLPKKHKMTSPGYQHLTKESIPEVEINGSLVQVVAGELQGAKGPAKTFTRVTLLKVWMKPESILSLPIQEGCTTLVLVVRGGLVIEEKEFGPATLFRYELGGDAIILETGKDEAVLLVMLGERIPEPVVGHGPFVMNTAQEIYEAMNDFEKGTFLQ